MTGSRIDEVQRLADGAGSPAPATIASITKSTGTTLNGASPADLRHDGPDGCSAQIVRSR